MKKGLKISLITIAIVIGLIIVLAGGYVGYIFLSYSRLGDMDLSIDSKSTLEYVDVNTQYSCTTYNIGFGAYSQDYTFFMDTGYDEYGNETCGKYGKAFSKEYVETDTAGAINAVKELSPDFMLFQEVDTKSSRSYKVNQHEKIVENFEAFDSVHCVNFHAPFLPYPLNDMHGYVNAGLTSLSKYKIQSAQRKQYTVSDSFSKLFDLDRCFSVCVVKVTNEKNLYIVNSHMSAYDKGGTIREKQMQELNNFLKACQDEGHYVLVGGDFNHDLITYNPMYSYTSENKPHWYENAETHSAIWQQKKAPDWVAYMFNEEGKSPIIDGYTIYAAENNPTCRNNDMEWVPGSTYVCAVDGYIASNNIKVNKIEAIQTKNGVKGVDGYAFSDHEPVYIEFELIG
ncbi:MAG: endonuclease [Clostridiales bacterium]|nr:endonuclease [Clostridiales bacterium]